ncbi:MAG: CCA tRNA nucleotidyltransferase [Planctomycetota bacterium]
MSEVLEKARGIARRLGEAGHEAYFAGGCVRDRLLGRTPKDIDIATSARPGEVQRLFRRTLAVGKAFGVIVVLDGEDAFDVATFRTDGAYGDGRRPDEIVFSTAVEDVRRRDFTINGLLQDPSTDEVIDHVGGVADLERRVIRTIGDARERFGEDRLRILRAVRFAARLDFAIDPDTAGAIRELAAHAADPSAERVSGELGRMWSEADPAGALRLLEELALLDVVLPEVAAKAALVGDARLDPEGRGLNALERTRRLLAARGRGPADLAMVWAVLLEDLVADPRGESSRPAAPARCARAAVAVLERLRSSRELMTACAAPVALRDRLLFPARPSATRRALLAAREDLDRLVAFRDLEAVVADPSRVVPRLAIAPAPLPAPLLRGNELAALGVPKGPSMGRVLRRLRVEQLEGRVATADAARDWSARGSRARTSFRAARWSARPGAPR